MDDLSNAIAILDELQDDPDVSKNIRVKIVSIKKDLEGASKDNFSLVVNKVLSDVEEISNDVNLHPFIRTRLWSLTSLLESLA